MSKFHTKSNIHVTKISLKVKDMEKSIKFYKEVLGFKILEKKENKATLTTDNKRPLIELKADKNLIEKPKRRTGLYHIAILLPNNIQLGLLLKNIRDMEYPIAGGSNHGVSQAIYLEDINGNGIEICADSPDNLLGKERDRTNMTSLPLDYKKLIKDAEGLEWNGLPEDTIIGHIHLHVSDIEESKRFYKDGIGLNIVSEIRNSAVFLSSAGYHHHIAFNIWNGRGAKALPGDSVGMEYYTISFPNKWILDKTLISLDRLGYNILKKNNNIFTKDPSENLIKLDYFKEEN